MKGVYLLYLLFVLLAFSCEKSDKKPPVALEKEEMAGVLSDMCLMEAIINSGQFTNTKIDTTYKMNVFAEHKISPEVYEKSLEWYSSHPHIFKEVYVLVMEKLNKLKSEKLDQAAKSQSR